MVHPHAHCLLWVDGAPHIDVDTDEDVCSFIDMYVSGIIPNNSNENKHISKMVKNMKHTHIRVIADATDHVNLVSQNYLHHTHLFIGNQKIMTKEMTS